MSGSIRHMFLNEGTLGPTYSQLEVTPGTGHVTLEIRNLDKGVGSASVVLHRDTLRKFISTLLDVAWRGAVSPAELRELARQFRDAAAQLEEGE